MNSAVTLFLEQFELMVKVYSNSLDYVNTVGDSTQVQDNPTCRNLCEPPVYQKRKIKNIFLSYLPRMNLFSLPCTGCRARGNKKHGWIETLKSRSP